MKKIYYFHNKKLIFEEFNKSKHLFLFNKVFISIFLTIILGIGYVILFNPFDLTNFSDLKKENRYLKSKILELKKKYENLNTNLDSLIKYNNDLRLAVNLPPISKDELIFGFGGNNLTTNYSYTKSKDLQELLLTIENLENKLEFEKQNFTQINNALITNKKLYNSIPAIKPCVGTITEHGFGMRLHPILGINRMHEGIDIITNIGTDVFAPGDGIVDYVGIKGGLGLVIEVDHGFGYRTIFGHLSKTLVKAGTKIKRGDLIAKTGNTGLSTGPHLHYEVLHNGINLDPKQFFFDESNLFSIIKIRKGDKKI